MLVFTSPPNEVIWREERVQAFRALTIGALLAVGLLVPATALGAVDGRSPSKPDGRIPGKPDIQKVGKERHVYEKQKGTYRIERKGKPDMTMVHHPPAVLSKAGPAIPLPQHQNEPWCVSGGHRIVPVYVRSTAYRDPAKPDLIRSIIKRMNWKFMNESLLSSGNTKMLRMVVECNQYGNIEVREVNGNSRQDVESQLGMPEGRYAVKYLAFNEACLDGSDSNAYTGQSSNTRYSVKSSS